MRTKIFWLVAVGLFAGALSLSAQTVTVNPAQISPSQIDFSKVDLSGVKFYFENPAELYVTGIRYNGYVYSAVLSYTGNGEFAVKAPQVISTAGKPQSIDLSKITVSLAQNGLELHNIGIDGMSFSGKMVVVPPNKLAVSNYTQTGTMGASQQASSEVATLQNKVNSLQGDVSAKENTITNLQQQVSSQNQTITNLQQQVSSQNQTITNLQQQVSTQSQTITNLHQQVSSRDRTIASLRQQVTAGASPATPTVPSASDYPTLVANGFSGGSGALGDWVMSGGNLMQENSRSLFAKYTASVPQTQMQYFYQFSARATGSGWHGYGLHFLASGSQTPNGYGYGRSFLVWVTQDPEHLQTDKTFVQLYQSYDDVHMVQLASHAINGSIDQTNTISVAVDGLNDAITVLVNGKEAFTYHPPEGIGPASMVALRALGTVTFSSAQIRTK